MAFFSAIKIKNASGRMAFVLSLAALAMTLICLPRLSAQTATGSIVGTVTDPTGGVIPNAAVTLTNVDTSQVVRSTVTDQRGSYALTLLPPANYMLSVEVKGFRHFLQSGIKLNVGAALNMNVSLQIGQVSQKVVVTGQPSQLQTQTSSLGQVISNQPIVDLPVNGRNSYSFATLVPGVLASYGFTQPAVDEYNDQFVSINGSRPNANSFLLDGGVNSEPAFNGPGLYPSIDMVQEYKVQTNNYSAQFPNTAGGVVNVITKSGTNKFHGSLYEFHRSTGLNANNYFANKAGLSRPPFLFNQFGLALGGPIVPRHTFFFFSYEGLRWTQAVTTTATVPTAAERGGDFSGQPIPIYNLFSTTKDPTTGQYARTQFQNNIIPTGMIDPTAKALLNYLPLPNQTGNTSGVNNFISNASSPIDKNDFSLRIDQQLTKHSRMFGRFSISDTAQDRPPVWGNTPDLKIGSPVLGDDFLREMQATIGDTTVLSQRAALELNSSFVRYHLNRTPPGLGIPETQFGFPSYFSDLSNTVQCFPSISIAGVGSAQSIPNIGSGLAMGSFCFVGVLHDAYQVLNETGNVTVLAGAHTLKFGGDFGVGTVATARYNNAGGFYGFGPDYTQGPSPYDSGTGMGFASFLLGVGDFGFNYTGGPDEITKYKYYGGYFEDDWRANRRLTLNLGFRYDYDAPWTERFNRITNWNPTATSPLQVPGLALVGGLEFPGVNGLSRYQFNPDKKTGMQPRVGFAYYVGGNTVVRGGYGLFMAPVVGGGFNGNAVPNTGFLGSTNWVTSLDGVTPLNRLSNPYPQGFVHGTGSSLGLATDLGQSVVGMLRTRRTSYSEQWNIDVQHTFPMHFLVDVAYAGSHGIHLYGDYNADQLPNKYLSFGNKLLDQVNNPFNGYISS